MGVEKFFDGIEFTRIQRQRFFDKHMFAGGESFEYECGVQMVSCRNEYEVDVGIGQRFVGVGAGECGAITFGERARSGPIAAGNRSLRAGDNVGAIAGYIYALRDLPRFSGSIVSSVSV